MTGLLDVTSPYDGAVVGQVPLAGPRELEAALAAAALAGEEKRRLPAHARSAAREHGKGFGIAGAPRERLAELLRGGGADLLVHGVDVRLYAAAADAAAASAREALA